MKFYINSKEFKSTVEKAAVICPKNPVLPFLQDVHMTVENGKVTFETYNVDEYIKVSAEATTIEDGDVSIVDSDIKKLFNVTGEEICIETSVNFVKARSEKKQCAVPFHECKDREYPAVNKENPSFTVEAGKLLETLKNLSKCLSSDFYNKLMQGYNFRNDRIQALDSHRIGIRKMDWIADESLNITVPGISFKALKQLIGKDTDQDVTGYSDGKWLQFNGNEFIYRIRLTEGEYYSVDRVTEGYSPRYTFEVDSKEMADISKEYAKLTRSEENRKAMIINFNDGELSTVLLLKDYKTSDHLSVKGNGLPKKFNIGVNPRFIQDATEVFSGDVEFQMVNEKTPIHIVNNDYRFIILPVNLGQESEQEVDDFLMAS